MWSCVCMLAIQSWSRSRSRSARLLVRVRKANADTDTCEHNLIQHTLHTVHASPTIHTHEDTYNKYNTEQSSLIPRQKTSLIHYHANNEHVAPNWLRRDYIPAHRRVAFRKKKNRLSIRLSLR
jgi:hypothetical protein